MGIIKFKTLYFVFAVVAYTCGISHEVIKNTVPYDGIWWQSVTRRQRAGFLDGYSDCYTFDVPPTVKQCKCQTYEWESEITKYYANNYSKLSRNIIDVLFELCNNAGQVTAAGSGEHYSEKHGFFDGEFWRSNPPDARLGFIQGYLYCQKKYNKPSANFSRPAQWYVEQISKWYKIDPNDPGQVDAQRSMSAIADVLFAINQSNGEVNVSTEMLSNYKPHLIKKGGNK